MQSTTLKAVNETMYILTSDHKKGKLFIVSECPQKS